MDARVDVADASARVRKGVRARRLVGVSGVTGLDTRAKAIAHGGAPADADAPAGAGAGAGGGGATLATPTAGGAAGGGGGGGDDEDHDDDESIQAFLSTTVRA